MAKGKTMRDEKLLGMMIDSAITGGGGADHG